MYLEQISKPKDLNKLSIEQLNVVSSELREALLFKLSHKGGHNGPNLGVVELTVALHYVFNSPIDKLVFDISHQTYIHKMLTGRLAGFTDPDHFGDITGYTDPRESDHDFFTIGHTSTSVSLAHGMAKARDLKGDNENIIAIIGDGSLSGGEALEGLSNAGDFDSNLIIIVNDNDQSIAENHGGLYKNLRSLREGNGVAETNLFTAMGLDYKFVGNGHDLEALISTLEEVKDTTNPVVVHVVTTKGKGFKAAEENREAFHAGGPIDLESGEYKFKNTAKTYGSETAKLLMNEMDNDNTVAVLTAGTPSILGFNKAARDKYSKQFIDVGIAEEHAVAMASAMAKNGAKPVFGVFSTFLQRTYDQISHDTCIDENPATFLVYGGSVKSMNDVTHICYFDIPMISNIPNLVYLAPTSLEEHLAMTKWAIHQTEYTVAIRVPVGQLVETGAEVETDYSDINKYQITSIGRNVAVLGLGNFHSLALEVRDELRDNHNIDITVINPRYITGVDTEMMDSLHDHHELVITLEDGQLEGGFGSKIATFFADTDMRVKPLGVAKEFHDKFDGTEMLKANGISKEQIVELVLNNVKAFN